MKNHLPFIFLFLFVLFVIGCSPTLYTSTNEELTYEPTITSNISVTTNDFSDKAYVEIGFVSTLKTDLKAAKEELKEYAAKAGGNAIINFKVSVIRTYLIIIIIPIPIDNYVCSGTVIKYI
jgi:hypothetical protein